MENPVELSGRIAYIRKIASRNRNHEDRAMKRLIIAAFLLIAGCAGTAELIDRQPLRKRSVSYTLGQEQERSAGETMVVEEDLLYHTATVARSGYRIPPQLGSVYPEITEGMEFVPHARLWNGDTLFKSEGLRPRTLEGKPVSWEYCIAVDRAGRAYGDAACSLGMVRKWSPASEVFIETKLVARPGSSRKELIYGGMSGNTIKIVYREFSGDMPAASFQQELAYDLSKSGTIRFRGMEMEVRVATSNTIRFIVLSPIEGDR